MQVGLQSVLIVSFVWTFVSSGLQVEARSTEAAAAGPGMRGGVSSGPLLPASSLRTPGQCRVNITCHKEHRRYSVELMLHQSNLQ